jgi:Rrf2 family protein
MMIDIAENCSEGFVPIKEISKRQDISVKYLEQIVSQLTKSGLLRSGRGSQGGYALTKTPGEYAVGEILRIAEGGNIAPVACLADENFNCNRRSFCQTLGFWKGLRDTIDRYVDSVSLQSLLKDKAGKKRSNKSTMTQGQ